MIRCEHLTKVYNGVAAVDDLCLEIPPGEIFGLLGPNGAGKSTTILMLIGLIEPTSGACFIDGIEVAKNPIEVKHRIGYMPEDVGFYATLTAEENLEYSARLFGMDAAERRKRIPDLLSLVGLDGIEKQVGGYSKGMRQRLGLARALINDPSLIILDEPTANLDPQGVADYRRIIGETADNGTTVLVSSHILSEVNRVCTAAAILARGRLVASGTRDDLTGAATLDQEGIAIRIETYSPMPPFDDPAILSADYSETRQEARIVAQTDIRERIADRLLRANVPVRRIEAEQPDLEEVLLSYYGGEASS
ncbi:ABC transporter ATP-binding protein [Methanofollis fontis]|uniref:ABC transporter ATP-binding protein n=1 Tax=Methanofollis fontis TaxID=2052832 RepID=A0A483CRN7_9EURY|nr:ABC transporter ATP-binding protein [Methanofollis fontis]TAJ45488.1 ABC transporter ATP-binding protein [Methanofollis fontis]